MRQKVHAYCEEHDVELILLEPESFDAAIIGIAQRTDGLFSVAYDEGMCVALFASDMGMEDAMEYYEFNTFGAWLGDSSPVFIDRLDDAAD